MNDNIYIARQPIVTTEKKIFGYELLFRSVENGGLDSAIFSDGTFASTRVAVNTLNYIGLEKVVGDALASINIDSDLILSDAILSLPKERFILELLETLKIDERIVQRIIELKKLGFKFALDDAKCDTKHIEIFRPIFPYIDILKLDTKLIDKQELESHIEELKAYNFTLLAEKVETLENFEYFKKLGCSYFQGFFFAKPNLIKQKALDPIYAEVFELINLLDNDSSIEDISNSFENSPDITIQLLKFMNSSSLVLKTNIRSIKHAIAILGRAPLKRWLLLIAFSKSQSAVEGIRSPVIILAQSRANLMGELASKLSSIDINKDEAALTGILSLIDVITEIPMKDVLKDIQISDTIKNAIIDKEGDLGVLLDLAIAIETSDFQSIESLVSKLEISNELISASVIQSYHL